MSLMKFDGSNFNFWKEQIQYYLIVRGQIDPIETENPLEGYKPNEWQKLERSLREAELMTGQAPVMPTETAIATWTVLLWKE